MDHSFNHHEVCTGFTTINLSISGPQSRICSHLSLLGDCRYIYNERLAVLCLPPFFIVLSDGHHIVRALLSISNNRDGPLLQFGDIITINQYTTVVTKETYIIMIGDFYLNNSRANEPNGFPTWFTINVDHVKDSKSLKSNNKV